MGKVKLGEAVVAARREEERVNAQKSIKQLSREVKTRRIASERVLLSRLVAGSTRIG